MRTTEIVLSHAELTKVLAALGPGNLDEQLANYGDVNLTRGSLACLKPEAWLNDEGARGRAVAVVVV